MAQTPLETLIASLMGCTNVILNKIAEGDGVVLDSLRVDAEATLDLSGATLQKEVSVPFTIIKLLIAFSTTADDARVDKLKADLGRFCPVSKVLRQFGFQPQAVQGWGKFNDGRTPLTAG